MIDDRDIIINQGKTRRPFPWRVWLALGVLIGLPLALGLAVLAWRLASALGTLLAPWGWLLGPLVVVVLVIVAINVGRIAFAAGSWAAFRAAQAALVPLQNDQPIHVFDLRHLTPLAPELLHRHYDVQAIAAERSGTPALSTLTQTVNAPAALPESAAAPALPSADQLLGLDEARARGLISRDQWYVGQAADGPLLFSWKHTGCIALSGVPGSGKSNTAALIAGQVAAQGGMLYVCDPQAGDAESLANRIAALDPAIGRLASVAGEINELITLVDAIYQRRNRNESSSEMPIMLLIDEFLELLIRDRITTESLQRLLAINAGGRKKRVNVLLISQDWSADILGHKNVSLRQLISHALVHRGSEASARRLLPGAAYARLAATAGRGQLVAWGDTGAPTLAAVPLVREADLQQAVSGMPARPPRPLPGIPVAAPAPAMAVAAPPPRQAPPTVLLPPLTIADQIVTLLQQHGPLDSAEIIRRLGANEGTVRNQLTKLANARTIERSGDPKNYQYRVTHSLMKSA